MSTGDVAVAVRALTKRYGSSDAITDVSVEVNRGEVVALLGPSGCSKTTTLRLIAGFEVPDAGEVAIDGVTVAGARGRPWVETEHRRVGMVFQQLALFPHMTVAANVAYGLRGAAWERTTRRARIGEMLDLVDLAGMAARFPDELSGGQAQRVAVARALAPRPAVVLLDEPFSSLDVSLRSEVRNEVRRILREANATAMLVTHDQDEALALGDRVAVMLAGRVAQIDTPEAVYRTPSSPLVASFLGDANLIRGDVRSGVLHTPIGPLEVDAPDGPSLGLVRPEDIDLIADPEGAFRVVDVEYYGHDQLLTIRSDAQLILRSRLHARRRFDVGTTVAVRVGGLGVQAFRVP